MTPLVSIIIPVYKVEKFIERCARSIFEQTYENLEIIFVNDSTPDNSIEILNYVLNDYPHRKQQTHVINFETNQGVASARNTGMKNSTGKYSIQFDSDDYVESTMIEEMVTIGEKESADITICDFMYIYPNQTKHLHVNPSLNPHVLLQQVLTGEVHSSLCNKLIKRTLYLKHDITFIEGLNMREDLSVMFRLLYFTEKIAYIPKPFYNYIQTNTASYTTIKRINESIQANIIELVNIVQCFYSKNNDITINFAIQKFKALSICYLLKHGCVNAVKDNPFLFQGLSLKAILTHNKLNLKGKILTILALFKRWDIIKFTNHIYQ